MALALPLVIGAVGAWATSTALVDWYPSLQKPSWNPPSWIFGPVWTSLYLLMGYASWRIFRQGWSDPTVRRGLRFYGVQLALNLGWSLLFFGLQRPGLALLEIFVLLALVLMTMREFMAIDRWAGWLLAPYLLWSTFATMLNASIWWLNR